MFVAVFILLVSELITQSKRNFNEKSKLFVLPELYACHACFSFILPLSLHLEKTYHDLELFFPAVIPPQK